VEEEVPAGWCTPKQGGFMTVGRPFANDHTGGWIFFTTHAPMTMRSRQKKALLASHCLYNTMVLDCMQALSHTHSLSTHNNNQTMKHILPLVFTTTLFCFGMHPAEEPRFLACFVGATEIVEERLGDPRDLIRKRMQQNRNKITCTVEELDNGVETTTQARNSVA
jgi:hypothetical protein